MRREKEKGVYALEIFDKVLIVVPSLSPDDKLIGLLENLRDGGFPHVMIVNDGSDASYKPYFDRAAQEFGCRVLRHHINYGKGRALKTAYNEFLNEYVGFEGVVTVDSDGQHTVEDVRACIQAMREHPDALVLGSRDFSGENVPSRSRFGNVLTRKVFGWLCGVHISDTQTGLRAMSYELTRQFLTTKGERFEYEMNQLIDCSEKRIPIVEVPIDTIYIEENRTSHFNPLKDSMRVYAVFGKFILSSFSAVLVDLLLFYFFLAVMPDNWLLPATFIATVAARLISMLYNFAVNRKAVFRNHACVWPALLRYIALAIPVMCISGFAVSWVTGLLHLNDIGALLIKMVVDVILFFCNFQIQRVWVFKEK
jgi:glycosyltransferase involved in cell wall biosynthesis